MSERIGPLTQLAWVTDDIAASERQVSAELGAGAWTRLSDVHFSPQECTYLGQPADFVAHISLTYVGEMQLELIEPVRGRSIYNDDPDRPGHCMHHVCLQVDDLEHTVQSLGREVVQGGVAMGGQVRYAYVRNSLPGTPYLELMELGPHAEAFYAAIKTSAHGGTASSDVL